MKKTIGLNIDLLFPTANDLKFIGEITSTLTTDNVTKKLHDEGLYSQIIFGGIGSEERNKTFGYINLHTEILHPLLYNHFCSLSAFYKGILEGKIFAKWDDKEKNFIKSDSEEGDTGYSYFVKYINKLIIPQTGSRKREIKINVINKYKDNPFIKNLLVLPAGLREYQEDESGRPMEDEINDMYRSVINLSSVFKNLLLDKDEMYTMDMTRLRLQVAVNKIHDYFITLNNGKSGFIQHRFTKRSIDYGTANVITSIPISIDNLENDESAVDINDTQVGLFQYAKAISPIARANINNNFLSNVFTSTSNMSLLVNTKTLKTESVEVESKVRDKWISTDGLDNILSKLIDDDVKNSNVIVGSHYLALVYDDGKTIRYVKHTDEIPESMDKKKLRPITYGELVYLSVYESIDKYPALVTRYPVTGQGSIYPSNVKVKTTTISRDVIFYPNIADEENNFKIFNYPLIRKEWVNSLSPHYTKLVRLGADFDGDKCSFTVLYTDASKELRELMNSPEFYVSPTGKPVSSLDDDVVSNVLKTITRF